MRLRQLTAVLALWGVLAASPAGQEASTATTGREAALTAAVKAGDMTTLHTLLARKPALLELKDDSGRTLLHLAVAAGKLPVVSLLLTRGLRIDTPDTTGITPLHLAAMAGQEEVARLLLEQKNGIDARDATGETPLAKACARGRAGTASLLLDAGASVDIVNAYLRTPLLLVARESGHVEIARMLLDRQADVEAQDRFGDSPLTLAAWRGFGPLVDLLLERGAHIPEGSEEREVLLAEAASHGLDRLFVTITGAMGGIPTPKNGRRSLLHEAAAGGSLKVLVRLLKARFDPNQPDADGWTPLHDAAYMGRLDAIRVLIEKGGADPNRRNRLGQSPWNLAVEHDRAEVTDLLTSYGADRGAPRFPVLTGPYLGQPLPGTVPEPFAPGLVGGHFQLHSTIAFSPDGTEAYWTETLPPITPGYGTGRTMVSRRVANRWTYPQLAMAGGRRIEDVPVISADGLRLYDMARRPLPGDSGAPAEHIWVSERFGEGWGEPRPLDPVINSRPQHWQFAVDAQGSLYFSSQWEKARGLFVSRFVKGRYTTPASLRSTINVTGSEAMPFVARDGSYLLFSRNYDLWVSFRDEDGRWMKAVPLPPTINTSDMEICPSVSPDGRYLFFLRGRLFWVDAGVIEELRSKVLSQRKASLRRP